MAASGNALLAAVLGRQAAEVERLLGEQPQLVNERGPGGLSAVWAAAAVGDAALVRRLAAAGADVDARLDYDGVYAVADWVEQQGLQTPPLHLNRGAERSRPIHAAARGGHAEVVELVLAEGAAGGRVAGDKCSPLVSTVRLRGAHTSVATLAALCAAAPGSMPEAVQYGSAEARTFLPQQLQHLHIAGMYEPPSSHLESMLMSASAAKCEPAWCHFLPLAAELDGESLRYVLSMAVPFPNATAQLQQLLDDTADRVTTDIADFVLTLAAMRSAKPGASLQPLRVLVGALGQHASTECVRSRVYGLECIRGVMGAVEALRLLLGLVRPQLPVAAADALLQIGRDLSFLHPDVWHYPCPVHAALRLHKKHHDNSNILDCVGEHCHGWLLAVELLVAAGYRPRPYSYTQLAYQPEVLHNFDPIRERPADFDILTTNKYLWLAAQGEPWSQQTHARYPPAFKAAVRTLLLAAGDSARRQQGRIAALVGSTGREARAERRAQMQEGGGPTVCPLAALPPPLLLRIVGQAAYPLSAWLPLVEGETADSLPGEDTGFSTEYDTEYDSQLKEYAEEDYDMDSGMDSEIDL